MWRNSEVKKKLPFFSIFSLVDAGTARPAGWLSGHCHVGGGLLPSQTPPSSQHVNLILCSTLPTHSPPCSARRPALALSPR